MRWRPLAPAKSVLEGLVALDELAFKQVALLAFYLLLASHDIIEPADDKDCACLFRSSNFVLSFFSLQRRFANQDST